jgi:uncharacterized protein
MGQPADIEVDGVAVSASLSRPPPSASPTARRSGLVICHGFPAGPWGPAAAPQSIGSLADRLAAETGWLVLNLLFRGVPGSGGQFSVGGWLADLRSGVDHLLEVGPVEGVWLAGFSIGGTMALCTAGEDDRVRGVAAFGAPADLNDWVSDPRRTSEHFKNLGIKVDADPKSADGWVRQFRDLRPLDSISLIPPRPVLLVHGAEDEVVPVVDARALADAAQGEVELRVLAGAGHGLRHDPRAIAILLGWLDRQTT